MPEIPELLYESWRSGAIQYGRHKLERTSVGAARNFFFFMLMGMFHSKMAPTLHLADGILITYGKSDLLFASRRQISPVEDHNDMVFDVFLFVDSYPEKYVVNSVFYAKLLEMQKSCIPAATTTTRNQATNIIGIPARVINLPSGKIDPQKTMIQPGVTNPFEEEYLELSHQKPDEYFFKYQQNLPENQVIEIFDQYFDRMKKLFNQYADQFHLDISSDGFYRALAGPTTNFKNEFLVDFDTELIDEENEVTESSDGQIIKQLYCNYILPSEENRLTVGHPGVIKLKIHQKPPPDPSASTSGGIVEVVSKKQRTQEPDNQQLNDKAYGKTDEHEMYTFEFHQQHGGQVWHKTRISERFSPDLIPDLLPRSESLVDRLLACQNEHQIRGMVMRELKPALRFSPDGAAMGPFLLGKLTQKTPRGSVYGIRSKTLKKMQGKVGSQVFILKNEECVVLISVGDNRVRWFVVSSWGNNGSKPRHPAPSWRPLRNKKERIHYVPT